MPAPHAPDTSDPLDAERLRGLGAFFVDRPDRILAVAGPFQREGRVVQSRVKGPSMGKTLPDGAQILIGLCRRERYAPGSIVAFVGPQKITVHRVAFCGRSGRGKGVLVTRGDASLLPDPPLDVGSVLGEVIGVQADGRWKAPAPCERRPALHRFVARTLELWIAGLCRLSLPFARWAVTTAYGSRRLLVPVYRRLTAPAGAPRNGGPRARPRWD
jgi:hypothetical protein